MSGAASDEEGLLGTQPDSSAQDSGKCTSIVALCSCILNVVLIVAVISLFLQFQTSKQANNQISQAPVYESSSHVPTMKYPYAGNRMSYFDMYPPFMVGATWGTQGCNGVSNTTAKWAFDNGCASVPEDTDGDCIGDGDLIARTSTQAVASLMGLTGSSGGPDPEWPVSAVAIKFSWQLVQSTMQWSDFEFTLSDGSTVQPSFINVAPDNDPDEMFTVTTFGNYGSTTYGKNGDWSTGTVSKPFMTKVTVVDDLLVSNGTHTFNVKGAYFEGGNLNFNTGGVLAIAYIRSISPDLNPIAEGSDNCASAFPSTTHVLTAQTMGGTTYDGVNGFLPQKTELFDVRKKSGGLLSREAYLGLADIDGDDFTDICLKLDVKEVDELDQLIMNCNPDKPCQSWALPHGNKDGFAPCTHTKPQPITKPRCPGAVVCR